MRSLAFLLHPYPIPSVLLLSPPFPLPPPLPPSSLSPPSLTDTHFPELGWFGEYPGYYNYGTHNPAAQGMPPAGYPQYPYPYMPGYPQMQQPSPGTAIVIQPGINGAPPTITQVPASTV